MSTTTDQLLQRATVSTFESLAFLFAEDECSAEQLAAPLDGMVSVEFHGPMRGRLVLRVSASLMPAIAANMLGDDESHLVPLQRDALGEMTNVVCGNLLPLLAGSDAVFRLDAPQWRGADQSAFGTETDARSGDMPVSTVTLGVDDGRVETQLFVFSGHEVISQVRSAASVG